MSLRAEGMIETKSWEENAYREANSGPKFTRASVDVSFRGDIEGEGAEEYLMVTRATARRTSWAWSAWMVVSMAAPAAS